MSRKRLILNAPYTRGILPFDSRTKYYGSPTVNVILKSPSNNIQTKFSTSFMLDTGAGISIVNKKFDSFIKLNLIQKDILRIKYGAGNQKKLPVYEIIFIINGKEISSSIAYDANLPYQLLGHHDFFENFSYNLFDTQKQKSRLYRF